MKVVPRYKKGLEIRAIILIAESDQESLLIDRIFGTEVHEDGSVGISRPATSRLSDGFMEHYIEIKKE